MNVHELGPDAAPRILTAAMLIFLGIGQIVWPRCFADIGAYFRHARSGMPETAWERVRQALQARRDAEGVSLRQARWVGALGIAFAFLELIVAIPFALPYAAYCLVAAGSIAAGYLRIRRATERRVAPLVRRSPLDALPPIVIAGTLICIGATLVFAAFPEFRLAALAVAIASTLLLAVAWKIAAAPAVLAGEDPTVDYAVDEHVRLCRATNVASLACAPAAYLVLLDTRHLPPEQAFLNPVAMTALAAFFLVLVLSLLPFRKRLVLA